MSDSLLRLGAYAANHGLERPGQFQSARDVLLRSSPRLGDETVASIVNEFSPTDAAKKLALRLDNSILPIQGPPGSGKTYTGAQMILESPVVFYSMATSTPEDAPRGMEFLYSLNRPSVAMCWHARKFTMFVAKNMVLLSKLNPLEIKNLIHLFGHFSWGPLTEISQWSTPRNVATVRVAPLP